MGGLLAKINRRELVLLLAGVSLLVVTAMVVGLLLPNAKAMVAAQQEVQKLEAASQDGALLEQQLQQQRVEIGELNRQLYGDMAALPVRQVEAFIIGRLQRVSWQNQVELLSVEPASGDQVRIFQELLFNVQLLGDYADLYQWLREMRDELGYVVVKEYELSRADDADENPRLAATLSLAAYRPVE